MSDANGTRFDRIELTLDRSTQRQDRNAEQIAANENATEQLRLRQEANIVALEQLRLRQEATAVGLEQLRLRHAEIAEMQTHTFDQVGRLTEAQAQYQAQQERRNADIDNRIARLLKIVEPLAAEQQARGQRLTALEASG